MNVQARAGNVEEFWHALVRLILSRKEPLVGEIISYIKADEDFFHAFISAIEQDRRKVLLAAIRRILIESSQKIFTQ